MQRQNSHTGQVWVPMEDLEKRTIDDKSEKKMDNHTTTSIPNSPAPELTRGFSVRENLDDIRSLRFWKALFAEFLGTALLVLVAVGSTVQGWRSNELDIVQIALSFGLAVATSVWIIGHVSGGHINPAVTLAMLATRRISLIKALCYIIVQCAGSAVGAGLLRAFTPSNRQGGLGTTTLNTGVSPAMGVGIEFFITMLLVLTVFASCDTKRKDLGGSFPLSIGLSVTVGHLWAVEFCGSSMNPARSFGPALVMSIWADHWVYWVGPISGGIFAGLLYDNVLAANASLDRVRDFLMTSKLEDANFHSPKKVVKKLEEQKPLIKPDETDAMIISPVA